MNIQRKEKGFTIIEVVLVLAIAGLIFLMVFIALPALQRNQRDTARKSDVTIVAAAVTSFSSNNRGAFPTATQIITYASNVSDNSKTTTNTSNIRVNTVTTSPLTPVDSEIVVTKGTTCGAVTTTTASFGTGSTRQFTVVTKLESGNGQVFCQES